MRQEPLAHLPGCESLDFTVDLDWLEPNIPWWREYVERFGADNPYVYHVDLEGRGSKPLDTTKTWGVSDSTGG